MAIALKRGYGRAVDRNRAKRLIRESFRLFGPLQAPGYDMVFQAFPGDDIFSTRSAQVARLMLEAGFRPRPRP
jgi:ribonuclease P protein component